MKKALGGLLTAGLLAAAPGTVLAQVVCGDTITGSRSLDGDLLCATEPALTIGAGGSLNMNGHTVSCDGTNDGIVLSVGGTKLSNGVISNCLGAAVTLGGGGGHKLTNLVARSSAQGFAGSSGSNKLTNCSALSNNDGVSLLGDGNKLTRISSNVNSSTGINITGNGNKLTEVNSGDLLYGITIAGDGNKLLKSTSFGANQDGILVAGEGNKLTGNASDGNGRGFIVIGGNNKLVKNTALRNATDGFVVGGSSANALKGNLSNDNAGDGIEVTSTGNAVSKNTVLSNDRGVFASGTSNVINGNVGLNNGSGDFVDAAIGCVNTWAKNIGLKSQGCIQ